jgi:hypothetical protein
MLPYWMLFIVAATLATMQPHPAATGQYNRIAPGLFAWAALTLMIGYRYRVGGDWFNYYENYLDAVYLSIAETIAERGDPAFVIVSWLSVELGWEIYGVNLICGGVFSAGLFAFCRSQPRPWLCLTVAIPYLVIVVGMGYTRQSAAIGLVMLALTHLSRNDLRRFLFWVAMGALFHKSAVIVVPVAILARMRNPGWTLFWVGGTAAMLYVLLLLDFAEQLVQNYIEAEYESEGAAIRVFMNAVPAAVYLIFRTRLTENPDERGLWTWLSLLAIGFVPLLQVSPSSTAVDRVALYLIPLQLYVLSRVPGLLMREVPLFGVVVVIAYSALVEFVWLNYATFSEYWKPYRFYPFEFWFT